MIPISKPFIGEEEKKSVMDVLNSGMLAQGPKVKEFENEFAKLIGVKNAVAVNSGTAALHASLYTLGIKPGDEVITVPFTFVASTNCILMQNAKPVFVDIEPETFNIDPEKIKKAITKKTKAIVAIDLFGHPYDYDVVKEIAENYNLKILEDACQAVLAEYKGKKAGTLGDMAAFSFYATKNMMTGEGGMITTDNDNYAEQARRFRHHGQSEQTRYEYYDLGYNYRMMDIQAALGLSQLKKIHEWTNARQKNAMLLTKGLKNIKGIVTPVIKEGVSPVFHQYTIKVAEDYGITRDALLEKLKKNGIGAGIYYPKPLHLHPFFLKMNYRQGDFPVSEQISKEVISLPVHPFVTEDDIKHIINVIREV